VIVTGLALASVVLYSIWRRRKLQAEIQFGYLEFWPRVNDEFGKFFVVAHRLQDALNGLTSAARDPIEPYQRVILNLAMLSGVAMVETCTLAGNGLGLGAMKPVRSMLEYGINAEYLRLVPESRDDYLLWHWVEHWKLLQYIKEHMPQAIKDLDPDAVKRTEEEFDKVKPRFSRRDGSLRGSWCPQDLAARSAKTQFHEEYRLVYPMGSKLMHGTMGALGMYFKPEEDEDRITVPPSIDWAGHALCGGHLCVLRMVHTMCDTFGVESTPSREELGNDFHAAWAKLPG